VPNACFLEEGLLAWLESWSLILADPDELEFSAPGFLADFFPEQDKDREKV